MPKHFKDKVDKFPERLLSKFFDFKARNLLLPVL
jgi:hypothetical protein